MIRAIFFDSGHTLMRPVGGRWFPGHHFFDTARRHGLEIDDDEALAAAVDEAYIYLDANHLVMSLAEEEAQFAEYYRIILRALGREAASPLIAELAHIVVHEPNFEPYPDTREALERLKGSGLPLALITDAWPSVETKYEVLGFRGYFAAIVISSIQGCTKPDPGMFDPALRALAVRPEEVLFVDDGPDLVESAQAMGFQGLIMDREQVHADAPNLVRDLASVLRFVAAQA